MSIEAEELAKIALLARLRMEPEQTPALLSDLGRILDFVETLKTLDTRQVKPLGHPLEARQRLRPDTVTEPDARESLQQVAKATENGLYLVPRVIE